MKEKPGNTKREGYESALREEKRRLRENFDPERFEKLGAAVTDEGRIRLKVLKWHLVIRLDPVSMIVEGDGNGPRMVWQILALDYLNSRNPSSPQSFQGFVAFPEVRAYQKAYQQRVPQRLTHGVGSDAAKFEKAAEEVGGAKSGETPLRYLFRFFPNFELQVVREEADEEFPHECKVLFSDNALDVLSIESMIVAAEKLVSALEGKGPSS
ncbi:MAG: DUF3786 domain-containing protein [Planctomycetes bacterium]|nr:DUF3786 domain-containing protein [Planctomycetota bacterium]